MRAQVAAPFVAASGHEIIHDWSSASMGRYRSVCLKKVPTHPIVILVSSSIAMMMMMMIMMIGAGADFLISGHRFVADTKDVGAGQHDAKHEGT